MGSLYGVEPPGPRASLLASEPYEPYVSFMSQRMEIKSAGELRDELADTIQKAQLGVPTEVQNRGKRVAVVVPPEVWDKYLAYETADLRKLVADREDDDTEPLSAVLGEVVSGVSGNEA